KELEGIARLEAPAVRRHGPEADRATSSPELDVAERRSCRQSCLEQLSGGYAIHAVLTDEKLHRPAARRHLPLALLVEIAERAVQTGRVDRTAGRAGIGREQRRWLELGQQRSGPDTNLRARSPDDVDRTEPLTLPLEVERLDPVSSAEPGAGIDESVVATGERVGACPECSPGDEPTDLSPPSVLLAVHAVAEVANLGPGLPG